MKANRNSSYGVGSKKIIVKKIPQVKFIYEGLRQSWIQILLHFYGA
jgi:hypothetical protein